MAKATQETGDTVKNWFLAAMAARARLKCRLLGHDNRVICGTFIETQGLVVEFYWVDIVECERCDRIGVELYS
jgi:hypothetical protein